MARNYKSEYKNYQGKPKQIHNRVLRNAARRQAAEDGRVHKGDGKDLDHVKPLVKGGSNAKSNTRVVTAHSNRSFARTRSARMK